MSAQALPVTNARAGRREARAALAALAFVLAVTAVWWALALWPTSAEPPAWLVRARSVCFNVGPSGLPDAAGWLLLLGQPAGLVLVLVAGWGGALRDGLRDLWAPRAGRALLALCGLGVALGLTAAGARVASVWRGEADRFDATSGAVASEPLPDTYPRLDRAAPELGLQDQQGERLDLARLRGRPALVAFAFGHCETVCPALVHELVAAQRRVRASGVEAARVPRVAVVTLDPWRDTPSRLPALAQSWGLAAGDDAFALSGEVPEVNALLDRWNVPRERDPRTGQLDHPALVYVLDAQGRIAYAANGDAAALAELVGRL